MPFRATFDCLWCGSAHTCRGPDDLEGWAQLCPDCVGKAGDNGFLRFRLHQALIERGAAAKGTAPVPVASAVTAGDGPHARESGRLASAEGPLAPAPPSLPDRDEPDPGADMLAYYQARAPEYDDWYLRRGRYERGPIHDAAWNAELDLAGRWLDELPIAGEIVELAAGTGWWSPLLASKGELSMYDGAPAPLDRARERLVAHRLRAHLHVRDAWAEPDRAVDAVFTGFWLSHVPRARLADFLGVVRRWLQARWHVRLHRLAARPAVERRRPSGAGRRRIGPPPRRRPRVHDRQGLLRAGRRSRPRLAERVSPTPGSRRPAASS